MICGTCETPGLKTIAQLKEHREVACRRAEWAHVAELRKTSPDSADRAARRAMGVKGEPMDEETKEKLRLWKLAHAEELKDRKDREAAIKSRIKDIVRPCASPLKRKS